MLVPDQGPIQQFPPAAADPLFHDRIHSRRLDRGADDPHVRGPEHSVERQFARAPQTRVDALLARYRGAEAASREATSAVAVVAEGTQGPSRVLAAAEAVLDGTADDHPRRNGTLPVRAEQDERAEAWEPPGPVERTVLDLGVTEPEILRQAAELDSASERLITDAARLEPSPGRARPLSRQGQQIAPGLPSICPDQVING